MLTVLVMYDALGIGADSTPVATEPGQDASLVAGLQVSTP